MPKSEPPPKYARSVAFVVPRQKSRWLRRFFVVVVALALLLGGAFLYIRGDFEKTRRLVLESASRQYPTLVKSAFVTTEDPKFYEAAPGRSPITKQVVRYAAPQAETGFQPRVREFLITVAVDGSLSKEAILNSYLDNVYLGMVDGRTVSGVTPAAQIYFKKTVEDLAPGEVATLAGMVHNPTAYSPLSHPEAAKERRNAVLDRMMGARVITEAEFEEASKAPIR